MTEKDGDETDFDNSEEEEEIDAQDCPSDSSGVQEDPNANKLKSGILVSVQVEKPFINLNDYFKRNPESAIASQRDELPLVKNTPVREDPTAKFPFTISAEKEHAPEKRKFVVPKFNLAQERRNSAFKQKEFEVKQTEAVSFSQTHKAPAFSFLQSSIETFLHTKRTPLELRITEPTPISAIKSASVPQLEDQSESDLSDFEGGISQEEVSRIIQS